MARDMKSNTNRKKRVSVSVLNRFSIMTLAVRIFFPPSKKGQKNLAKVIAVMKRAEFPIFFMANTIMSVSTMGKKDNTLWLHES